ncbi:phosphatidylethanolamine-binding protein [Scheffersomyces xylosifermentans]|uniref:phosphatidylethanolamine-binding protein n=1 Tax=Scheffersomyces xylosifermentans TaxID=1304137 RepID=UPI00315D0669
MCAARFLGRLLYNFRGRDEQLLTNQLNVKENPQTITITSPLFEDNGYMPIETAGKGVGDDKSPSLSIKVEPNAEITSLVLILQDIDAPVPFAITHMLVYDIAPAPEITFELGELAVTEDHPDKFKLGFDTFKYVGYMGPRPVPGHGDHRYVFQVFGINETATTALRNFEGRPNTANVIAAIKGNVKAHGVLTGLYKRD